MATALSSAWSKPGKWALDSEEHESEQQQQQQKDDPIRENGQFDFPSLATAVAATTKSKKKKTQTLSLAEFNTGKPVGPGTGKAAQTTTQLNRLTTDELLVLPTGPREHTPEELERSRHGFRSYAHNDNAGRNRYSNGDDSSNSRWGSRVSDEPRRNGGFNRDSGPSRADEIDDWGATKKSTAAPQSERRERGGFFDSQSRADESDSWSSNKSVKPSEGRRFGGGFENHRERRGGFDMEISNGGGADSDTWGRKKEEGTGSENGSGSGSGSGSGRRRLVLQPRTLPVTNADQQQQRQPGSGSTMRSKGSNPFGEARPREEILAEKGQDWKKIDEQLESIKLKEMGSGAHDGPSLGKKSFGSGNGRASQPEDHNERNWRKTDTVDVPTESAEKIDVEGGVA